MTSRMYAVLAAVLAALAFRPAPAFATAVDLDTSYPNFNQAWDGSGTNTWLETCAVGDFNGDGNPDLVMVDVDGNSQGRTANGIVYIFWGPFTGNTQTVHQVSNSFSVRIDGPATDDQMQLCYVADVNNDGYEDLIVHAGGDSPLGADYSDLWVLYGGPNGVLGATVSTGTVLDLAQTTSYNVKIVRDSSMSGGSEDLWPSFMDVNGDGIPDMIIEAPWDSVENGNYSGSVYVIYGGSTWPSGTGNLKNLGVSTSWTMRFDGPNSSTYLGSNWQGGGTYLQGGPNAYHYFGSGVSVGDVVGSGIPALAIPAKGANATNGNQSGTTYISTGPWPAVGSTGNVYSLTNSANYMVRYDWTTSGQYGSGRTVIADFVGAGHKGLCIGMDNTTTLSRGNNGNIVCINGPISYSTTGNIVNLANAGTYSLMLEGDKGSDYLPQGDLSAVDLNNDGIADLEMGTPNWGSNYGDTGALFVVYGGTPGSWPTGAYSDVQRDLNTTANFNVRITDDSCYYDTYLTEVPTVYKDMDGDGITDLVLTGGQMAYSGCNNCAASMILYGPLPAGTGNLKTFNTDYNVRFHYNNQGGNWCSAFGWPFFLTADVDRDGVPDVISDYTVQNSGNFYNNGRVLYYSMAKLGPVVTAPNLFTNTTTPTITWTNPGAGTTVRVQVGPDPLFLTPVFDQTVINTLSLTVSPALVNGNSYYVRAQYQDGNFNRWGAVASFTVAATPMVAPVLVSPGNASGNPPTINTQTPQFNWTPASSQ